jgi:hypothetical protein
MGQGAPLTTQEIDSLVSPIALYPDSLVAQILAAATFPDQIRQYGVALDLAQTTVLRRHRFAIACVGQFLNAIS